MSPKEKSKSKKRIVLLDSHAILHRAFHAIPDFSTASGRPTGALYGLASMILSIGKDLKPDYIIACYDLPGGTFRNELSDGYKAHRKELDTGLAQQILESREVMDAFAIPRYEKKGYEADDLLGTLAEILKKDKNNEIIIASGDMDTLQLVDKTQVRVFTLKRGLTDTVLYDEKGVVERFGFGPKLLPDYKGLRGDPSDNIIGVAGIGEKTASILISNFGTIENIYKKLAKSDKEFREAGITPRIIELLRANEEEALFSKTLATIVRNVEVDFELPEKSWRESVSKEAVEKLFQDLEFRSLTPRFRAVFDIEDAPKNETDSSMDPLELKRLSIAAWLLDSEKTSPDVEDILALAKTNNLEKAKEIIFESLKKNKLDKVFEEIEEPIIKVIEEMKIYGIKVDKSYLQKLSKDYHRGLDGIEK